MFPEKEILILCAESSIHAGAGSDVGYVDNPIQRERATGFPIIQSSGVKGALREFFETAPGCDAEKVAIIFGPEEQTASGSGAVSFGEARVLLFPVRSLAGVFAYITCPAVLARFQRDLAACGKGHLGANGNAWQPAIGSGRCFVHTNSAVKANDEGVLLEEILFASSESDEEDPLIENLTNNLSPQTPEYQYLATDLTNRLVVLNNNDFAYFVDQATEIQPHNRIDDETGTVDETTGVWYTECLPSETIMYSCLFMGRPRVSDSKAFRNAEDIHKDFVGATENERVWIGGNRSTGKGRFMVHFWDAKVDNGKEEGGA